MGESRSIADWRCWLEENAPAFLLFARQQGCPEADAQDLVQESITEAWQRKDDGQPPPRALVFATIHRRAIDWARRKARRMGREHVAMSMQPQEWFDPSAEDRETARLIQEALRRLPDQYGQVITLKIWGGLTFAEIAEVLDIPANTAGSRYRYGLAELRKLTREVMYEPRGIRTF